MKEYQKYILRKLWQQIFSEYYQSGKWKNLSKLLCQKYTRNNYVKYVKQKSVFVC